MTLANASFALITKYCRIKQHQKQTELIHFITFLSLFAVYFQTFKRRLTQKLFIHNVFEKRFFSLLFSFLLEALRNHNDARIMNSCEALACYERNGIDNGESDRKCK